MNESTASPMERKKSYRWVSATKVNYDGSDWSDQEEEVSSDNKNTQEAYNNEGTASIDKVVSGNGEDESIAKTQSLEYLPTLPKLSVTKPEDLESNDNESYHKNQSAQNSAAASPENDASNAAHFRESTTSKELDDLMNQISKEMTVGSDHEHTPTSLASPSKETENDHSHLMDYSEDEINEAHTTQQSPQKSQRYTSDDDSHEAHYVSERYQEPAPRLLAYEMHSDDGSDENGSLAEQSEHLSSGVSASSEKESAKRETPTKTTHNSSQEDFHFKKNAIRHSLLDSSDEEQEQEEDQEKGEVNSLTSQSDAETDRQSFDSMGTSRANNTTEYRQSEMNRAPDTEFSTGQDPNAESSDENHTVEEESEEELEKEKSTKDPPKFSTTENKNVVDSRANFIQETKESNDQAENNKSNENSDSDDEVVVDADGNVIDASAKKSRVVSTYSEVGSTWNAFPSVMDADDVQTVSDAKTIYDNATIFNVPAAVTNNAKLPPLPVNKTDIITKGKEQQEQTLEDKNNEPADKDFDETQTNKPDHLQNTAELASNKNTALALQTGLPPVPLNKISKPNLPQLDVSKMLGDPKVSHAVKIERLKNYSKELDSYDTCISYWINDTLKSTVDKRIMDSYKVNVHVKQAYSNADELSKKNHLVANVNQNVHQLTKKVFTHSMREKSKGFLKSIRDKK
ncbi:hypothetical protein ACO0QE_000381 [Hanseniaspora vineae]